jgi:hypothetical protein
VPPGIAVCLISKEESRGGEYGSGVMGDDCHSV